MLLGIVVVHSCKANHNNTEEILCSILSRDSICLLLGRGGCVVNEFPPKRVLSTSRVHVDMAP